MIRILLILLLVAPLSGGMFMKALAGYKSLAFAASIGSGLMTFFWYAFAILLLIASMI